MRWFTRDNHEAIGAGINYAGMGDYSSDSGLYNPPADSGSDYGYGLDYYDQQSGIYYDQYGNQWDVVGSGIFANQDNTADGYDPNGLPVVRITTDVNGDPSGNVDLSALGQTLDWWRAISTDPSLPATLPAVPVSIPLILQIPDSGIPPPGLNLPPVVNALPPNALAKLKQVLKNIAQNGKATAGGSPSGSSSGSRPQAVKPSAGGQCPAGYTMSAGGYCLLNKTATTNNSLSGILSNPLYLLGGAILLVLLAKK